MFTGMYLGAEVAAQQVLDPYPQTSYHLLQPSLQESKS